MRRERTEDLLDLGLIRLSNKTATISGNVRSCESNPRWDCRNRPKMQPSSSDADSGGILFALFIRGLATKVASWRANDARLKNGGHSFRETKGSYLRLRCLTVELLGVVSTEWVARGFECHTERKGLRAKGDKNNKWLRM